MSPYSSWMAMWEAGLGLQAVTTPHTGSFCCPATGSLGWVNGRVGSRPRPAGSLTAESRTQGTTGGGGGFGRPWVGELVPVLGLPGPP